MELERIIWPPPQALFESVKSSRSIRGFCGFLTFPTPPESQNPDGQPPLLLVPVIAAPGLATASDR